VLGALIAALVLSGPVGAAAQTLTWTYDPAAVISGFSIERAPTDANKVCGTFAPIGTTAPGVLNYVDNPTMAGGASMCYRVLAYQGAPGAFTLVSPYSNTAVYTKPLPAPGGLKVAVSVTTLRGPGGSVVSNPEGIDCGRSGGPCLAVFDSGSTVVLTANPHGPAKFFGWSGDGACAVNQLKCAISMMQDMNIGATFSK